MRTHTIALLAAAIFSAMLLPAAAQDWAKKRLEDSPRHLEYIDVKHGDRTVKCLLVFPEVKEKATAVIVIHEIFGLSDWVKGVADQLAEAGYIAIAPDLLSGAGKDGGGTETFAGNDELRKAVSGLKPEQVTADLDAVAAHVIKLPAANGKLAVGGFCWGGGQSFRYATNNADLKAAFVFYGSGPEDAAAIAKIACPVYGFYASNDARVNATIPKSKELMKAADKTYDVQVYEGAGHGFMRAGEAPDASAENKAARDAGWKRWKEILEKL